MRGARVASISGLLLLTAACVLPSGAIADLAAAWLSYQDPHPGMVLMSPSEMAAVERRNLLRTVIALAGCGMLGYSLWRWIGRRRSGGSGPGLDRRAR